ncbi:hypothetical protein DV735_g3655, partial [Chaetothyriales sp. CBS 134920]
MDEGSDNHLRSRSNTTASLMEKVRPRSRGSTTSLQSIGVGNGFQPTPPLQQGAMPGNQQHVYAPQSHQMQQPMYHYQQDLLLQPQNIVQPMQSHQVMGTHTQTHAMPQHDMIQASTHGYASVQPYANQFPAQVSHWNMQPPPHMQMRQPSEQYEGSPAPEDSNSEARRKKGGSGMLANDQELRRLLSQNTHRKLPEVAADVQKSEGSGGKSEKAKQVFAMLWLRANCKRGPQSVRRDRVFAKYTENCGDMRVPTLNPASFGKLVRIIFPNVQTRRLGVRGESKYHYVDLALKGGDDDHQQTATADNTSTAARVPDASVNETQQPVVGQSSAAQTTGLSSQAETAHYAQPLLSANVQHHETEARASDGSTSGASSLKLDCKYSNTATIRLPLKHMAPALVNALPAIREGMPGTLSTYVAMPNLKSLTCPASSAPDQPFDLPDIHPYLEGQTHDPHMAKALSNLYRSYCIDVIDAFRKCKEKPFFSHHTAFNGKMTVPVAKLFNLECLAPWLHECDMRMYKQIISFLAPLAIQTVPDMVWMFFSRVSTKLVPHIISTFEEKSPVHVVVAKAVPAARFTNLLKKLKDANTATLQLNKMLNDPQQRTQMWLDLMVMVDPERLLGDSIPPAESLTKIQGILKHDMRILIEPREGSLVAAAEGDPSSSYAQLLNDLGSSDQASGVLDLAEFDAPPSLLEKWIGWLESLPEAFIGHHPQCMMDWHTKFWRSLMMQVGSGGAHSYQSWWYVETFAQQMLAWMCEMQGMLMGEQDQKREDAKEAEKKTEAAALASLAEKAASNKRARDQVDDEDTADEEGPRKQARTAAPAIPSSTQANDPAGLLATGEATIDHDELALPEMLEQHHGAHQTADEYTDAEMDEITRGGPLDLPSIHTGLTSPIKHEAAPVNNIHTTAMQATVATQLMPHHHHVTSASMADDSGIGLDLDDQDHDIENLKEARRFNKRDWLLSSDPVDGQAAVGLGLTA